MGIKFKKHEGDGVTEAWENEGGEYVFLLCHPYDGITVSLDGHFTLADLRQILTKAEEEGIKDYGH